MDDREPTVLELDSYSEAETIAIGRRIGERLIAGDLLLLLAPYGAGKTHLTKGVAAGLGADPDEVNSPSFVLINEYASDQAHGRIPIYHADLYRIENDHDLASVGLEDCFDGDGVCVIEWAERAEGMLPPDRLEIAIAEVGPTARRLRLMPRGARYQQLIVELGGQVDAARN